MDKETLLKLAQPAATCLLAFSIVTVPLISKADLGSYGGMFSPIHVKHVNDCAS